MFKDIKNGHTNFCLNCELLQRNFDAYKDVKEFEIARYKQCLYEIEEICKVHTDFCKDNKKNCELCPHEPCEDIIILQKIKEVRGEE